MPTASDLKEHAIGNKHQRVLVTGASGLLGSHLCGLLGERAIAVGSRDLDLLQIDRIRDFVLQMNPDSLVNCAAYTAVDLAEKDSERCTAINRDAVAALAEVTSQLGIPFVQISTDYVFGGAAPIDRLPRRETDPVAPAGVYAISKYEGELAAARNPRHLVVRTCGLYGIPSQPSGRNFVLTMLKLAQDRPTLRVVSDQECSPTFVAELAPAVLHLLESNASGTFHVVNEGGTTWHAFAEAIFRIRGVQVRVDPISSAEYNAPAARPAYSVLDIEKYRRTGGPPLSHWEDALRDFLNRPPG